MNMALPEVKQCCCGCTLELGTKIIAWWQAIAGVVILLSGLVGIIGGSSIEGQSPISQIISGIIVLLFGILLLMGIYQSRPSYINFWVTVNVIGMIIFAIFTVISCIVFLIGGHITVGIVLLIQGAIVLIIEYYCLAVVSSYRKEMDSGVISA